MNISNLKIGMIIKNYKELCKVLEIEVTDGNSKKAQLKELEEVVTYHKEGNKFVIDDIDYTKVGQNLSNYTIKNNNNNLYSLNVQNCPTFEKNENSDTKDKDKMTRSELEELEWSIMTSNIHKLLDGRTYTYPQICKALEIERKTGNAKISQQKQIERLVALERKKGSKFMVLKHYSIPLPKQDDRMDEVSRRTFGNMLLYGLMVEYFGIDGIDEEYEVIEGEGIDRDIKDIVVTRNRLYEHMDMVNGNYRRYKYNHKELIEYTQTHKVIVDDYMLSTELQLKGYLTKALNDLKDRCLIKYNECTMLIFSNGAKRLATKREEVRILEAEKIVLKDMDINSKYLIAKQNRNEEYYKKVNEKLIELSKDNEEFKVFENIKSYYKAINITTTERLLCYAYEELVEDVIKAMAEANDVVLESIVKHYNKDNCKYANRLIQEVNEGIKFGRIRNDDFFQELYVLNKVVIESNNFRYSPRRKEAEKYLINKDE